MGGFFPFNGEGGGVNGDGENGDVMIEMKMVMMLMMLMMRKISAQSRQWSDDD